MRIIGVDEMADLKQGERKRLERELFQDRPAMNEPPPGAKRVQPYKPNRKQRRAQEANARKNRSKK